LQIQATIKKKVVKRPKKGKSKEEEEVEQKTENRFWVMIFFCGEFLLCDLDDLFSRFLFPKKCV